MPQFEAVAGYTITGADRDRLEYQGDSPPNGESTATVANEMAGASRVQFRLNRAETNQQQKIVYSDGQNTCELLIWNNSNVAYLVANNAYQNSSEFTTNTSDLVEFVRAADGRLRVLSGGVQRWQSAWLSTQPGRIRFTNYNVNSGSGQLQQTLGSGYNSIRVEGFLPITLARTITIPEAISTGTTKRFRAAGTQDGLTFSWSRLSGGAVTFSAPAAPETDVALPGGADARIRLQVTRAIDNKITNFDFNVRSVPFPVARITIDEAGTATASALTGTVGLPIRFFGNNSTGAASVRWSWGDGYYNDNTTIANHLYAEQLAGAVTLTVCNLAADCNTTSAPIAISPVATDATKRINVSTEAELRAALAGLNASSGGTTINLARGSVMQLTDYLLAARRTWTGFVTIQSDGVLPSTLRQRIDRDSDQLATLVQGGNNLTIFRAAKGGGGIRFRGIRFAVKQGNYANVLVYLGDDDRATTLADERADFIFEHCAANTVPQSTSVRRIVSVTARNVGISACDFTCVSTEGDAQAVLVDSSSGNISLFNNGLASNGMGHMSGGGDQYLRTTANVEASTTTSVTVSDVGIAVPGLAFAAQATGTPDGTPWVYSFIRAVNPTTRVLTIDPVPVAPTTGGIARFGYNNEDQELVQNYMYKLLAWKTQFSTKNVQELKRARRFFGLGNVIGGDGVTPIRGQVHGGAFDSAQDTLLVWKSTPQSNGNEFTTSEDARFVHTIAQSGPNVLSTNWENYYGPTGPQSHKPRRYSFSNLLARNINVGEFTTSSGGKLAGLAKTEDVRFDHVTFLGSSGRLIEFEGTGEFDSRRLIIRDSIVSGRSNSSTGQGLNVNAYNAHAPGWTITNNALVAPGDEPVPRAGNTILGAFSEVGFVNLAGGNLALAPTSALRGTASDNGDPGVNMTELNRWTAGVVAGVIAPVGVTPSPSPSPSPAPSPSPSPAPTPSPTPTPAPVASAAAATLTASATTISAPGSLTLTGTVAGLQTINRAEFRRNGVVVSTDINAPYQYKPSFTSTTPNGAHRFSVRFYDNAGRSVESPTTVVTVAMPTNSAQPAPTPQPVPAVQQNAMIFLLLPPAVNPPAGTCYVYVQGGVLKIRTSDGVVTNLP